MKLYYAPGACSFAPHIVLHEAGVEHDLVKVDLKAHRTADGSDFYAVNPKGYVPVLELPGGERLTEVPAIVQYIADQAPGKGLAPATGTLARARVQEWLNFVSSELHKGFGVLFNPAMPDEAKKLATNRLGERFAWVDGQLQGRSYLVDDTFGVADAYFYTVSNWAAPKGVDLTPFTQITAYRERVGARPSVQAATEMERSAG